MSTLIHLSFFFNYIIFKFFLYIKTLNNMKLHLSIALSLSNTIKNVRV